MTTFTVTWVFGPVLILLSKKVSPLYEGVGSNLGSFKIYVYEFRLEFLLKKNKNKIDNIHH
jgi:hypothetical protein